MKKILISIFIILSSTNSINAKEIINLEKLEKLGIENNLKIKAFKSRNNIYSSQIISANSINNPVISTDISPVQKTYRIEFNQELELYSKRKIRVNEAEKNQELYKLELIKLINETKFDIRSKYNEISYLNLKVDKYNELIKSFFNLLEISKKREEAGDIPKIDTSQLELMYLDLLSEKNNILNNLNQEKINIQELIGISIPDLDLDKTNYLVLKPILNIELNKVYSNNIDIFYLNNLKEYFSIQKEKIVSENIPNFSLGSGLDIVTEENFSVGPFINFSTNIPIFYKKEGEIKETEAKILQLDSEIEVLKQSIKIKTNSYIEKLKFLKEQINIYEKVILPKSLELVGKSNKAFEIGKYGVINSISFHQNYIQSELKYIELIYEYKKNIINLEREVYNEII